MFCVQHEMRLSGHEAEDEEEEEKLINFNVTTS